MAQKKALTLSSENRLRTENARLRGHLEKAIKEAHYWQERAIFLEAERDYYRDQCRED